MAGDEELDSVAKFIQLKKAEVEAFFTKLWEVRPWWLRRRDLGRVFDPVIPNWNGSLKRVKRYMDRARLVEELELLKPAYPDLIREVHASQFITHLVFLKLKIEDNIPEIEPVMNYLFSKGWEVTDTDDDEWSRQYELRHPDRPTKLTVYVWVSDAEGCEIIEHREEETVERVDYEIVCEGERELTGRDI